MIFESIETISLSECDVSIVAPEPIFIVGAPVKSDFTYALMILIKSPGFSSSSPGRFAFSSQSLTLAVELLS